MKVCREAFSFKFAEVLSLGLLVAAFSYGMLVAVCVLSKKAFRISSYQAIAAFF